MKVKKLIKILQMCDPEAKVRVEARNTNDVCVVAQYEVNIPYAPIKTMVYIGDEMSSIDGQNGYEKEITYSESVDLDRKKLL